MGIFAYVSHSSKAEMEEMGKGFTNMDANCITRADKVLTYGFLNWFIGLSDVLCAINSN